MRKVLIACDGSDNALRAVRFAASLAKELPDVELDLLNVQDVLPQKVHAVLSEQEIAQLQAGEADLVLKPATQILDFEAVKYRTSSRTGSPASEIARHVDETQCDAIIMGSRGKGPMVNWVLGSVAAKVIHLVEVPVTLIK